MTWLTDLKTRRDAITAELAALSSTAAGGKPNASGGDQVDHVGYKKGLYEELRQINAAIKEAAETAAAESAADDGPYEIEIYGTDY